MPSRDSASFNELISRKRAKNGIAKMLCLTVAAASFSTAGVLTATPLAAQQIDEALYAGGKARVNRSASLRTLTESIASASCRVDGGIDAGAAQADLASAGDDFARIMDGLTNGSATLGMPGAESRGRTLNTLGDTAAIWTPLEVAVQKLATGTGSSAEAATIREGYSGLFDQTEQLAAVISGQYADPQALLQSDATVLNFAVRQRALAYRMTRAMCELATGTGTDATQQELKTSVDLFEQTLIALRDGFAAAGINPPPNETVRDSLVATFDTWSANRALFDGAIAGQTPSAADVAAAAAVSRTLSQGMNNAITLYLIATPGQDGVYRIPLEAYAREELTAWLSNPELIAAIKAQNIEHADLSEDAVIVLDQQWRAEAGEGGGPLIQELLTSDLSGWLLDQQVATAGFVTEVFIMDDKGLNVAQSVETSDYWQGDEAKWQDTYLVGPDALHISEVEFDDSTGFYQSQASISIKDPATGEAIGAVTFGINVQSLL